MCSLLFGIFDGFRFTIELFNPRISLLHLQMHFMFSNGNFSGNTYNFRWGNVFWPWHCLQCRMQWVRSWKIFDQKGVAVTGFGGFPSTNGVVLIFEKACSNNTQNMLHLLGVNLPDRKLVRYVPAATLQDCESTCLTSVHSALLCNTFMALGQPVRQRYAISSRFTSNASFLNYQKLKLTHYPMCWPIWILKLIWSDRFVNMSCTTVASTHTSDDDMLWVYLFEVRERGTMQKLQKNWTADGSKEECSARKSPSIGPDTPFCLPLYKPPPSVTDCQLTHSQVSNLLWNVSSIPNSSRSLVVYQ